MSVNLGKPLRLRNDSGAQLELERGGIVRTLTVNASGVLEFNGTQNMAIVGGSINGTPIGGTTASTGAFTTVSASTSVTTPLVTRAGTLALSATGANVITLATNGVTRLTVASGGDVGIGEPVSSSSNYGVARLSVATNTFTPVTFASHTNLPADGTYLGLMRSRGTQASPTNLSSGDLMGTLSAQAFNTAGTLPYRESASIRFLADGNQASGDLPGRIGFFTVPSGSQIPTERLRIDSAGNVGIGTTSPGARLHVRTASSGNTLPGNALGIFESDANMVVSISAPDANSAGVFFPRGTSAYYAGIDRNGTNLSFTNNDAERMRIDSAGNVGIGTTSPATTLDVVNLNTAISDGVKGLRVLSNVNGPADTLTLDHQRRTGTPFQTSATTGAGIKFRGFDGTNHYDMASIAVSSDGNVTDTSSPGALVFLTTQPTTTTVAERMRITSAGYVRLSANSPGIQFGGDTAAANALNDYEEGTWTPTAVSAGYTLSTASGTYTKIGNTVNIRATIRFSAVNSASTSRFDFSGLPFTPAQTTAGVAREDTALGSIFAVRIDPSITVMNSMDGVLTGSTEPMATARDYMINATYRV